MIWRLVLEHVATLHEIRTCWDLRDVLDAHIALNVLGDAEQRSLDEGKGQ